MTGWTRARLAGERVCLDRVPARTARTSPRPGRSSSRTSGRGRPRSACRRPPATSGSRRQFPSWRTRRRSSTILSRRRPDLVPELLAADFDRGWMLMADGGTRLRELIEEERDLGRWLDVLPRYAELQVDLAVDADRLVAVGCPDRRLGSLPSQYERLLEQVPHEFGGTVPRVSEMCAQIASLGIPETIQHDDLHDAQVFVRDGQYLFFDWGDSCVSHPFLSMSITLEGQIAWGLDDVEGSVDLAPFRDAYLEPYTRYAPLGELQEALDVALRLGWVCRAVNAEPWASAVESSAPRGAARGRPDAPSPRPSAGTSRRTRARRRTSRPSRSSAPPSPPRARPRGRRCPAARPSARTSRPRRGRRP